MERKKEVGKEPSKNGSFLWAGRRFVFFVFAEFRGPLSQGNSSAPTVYQIIKWPQLLRKHVMG